MLSESRDMPVVINGEIHITNSFLEALTAMLIRAYLSAPSDEAHNPIGWDEKALNFGPEQLIDQHGPTLQLALEEKTGNPWRLFCEYGVIWARPQTK